MSRRQRLDALEVAATRRQFAHDAPPGWTVDAFLDAAIAWLERPPEDQQADMPEFTLAELAELRSYLPRYRRARMAGR